MKSVYMRIDAQCVDDANLSQDSVQGSIIDLNANNGTVILLEFLLLLAAQLTHAD